MQPKKRTRIAIRFSTATGEAGSPDTFLDPKGVAIKFYTDEGIHDLTGNNFPVFMVREPMLVFDITKARKRNPQTHLNQYTPLADIVSQRPEMTMFFMFFLSDLSRPKSYRCMRGSAINTYKMVNAKDEAVYVRFHWIPDMKEEFFTLEEAIAMFAKNPDLLIQDLYDNIAKKNFPSWTLSIQVMTLEQAEKSEQNPFHSTKYWKTEDYPLIPVGKFTLNENPQNYFAQVEQIAFSPSNMVRGIEPSPDRLLQARMFAYPDAQLYRLGTNFAQIPVNRCPFEIHTYQRDGPMNVGNNGGNAPNYYPNSFNGLNSDENRLYKQSVFSVTGDVDRVYKIDDDDFSLPRYHYENHIGPDERIRMMNNLVLALKTVPRRLQKKVLNNILYKIHDDIGNIVKLALNL